MNHGREKWPKQPETELEVEVAVPSIGRDEPRPTPWRGTGTDNYENHEAPKYRLGLFV